MQPGDAACSARTEDPPHYLRTYACSRRATTTRAATPLCAQHARMVDRHGEYLLDDWKRESAAARAAERTIR